MVHVEDAQAVARLAKRYGVSAGVYAGCRTRGRRRKHQNLQVPEVRTILAGLRGTARSVVDATSPNYSTAWPVSESHMRFRCLLTQLEWPVALVDPTSPWAIDIR